MYFPEKPERKDDERREHDLSTHKGLSDMFGMDIEELRVANRLKPLNIQFVTDRGSPVKGACGKAK